MSVEVKTAIVLAKLSDGTVHQVALKKELLKTLLWLLEELCEGKIKVFKESITGIRIEGEFDNEYEAEDDCINQHDHS